MQWQRMGATQQHRRPAAQTGDQSKYAEKLSEGSRYASKEDYRRAAGAFREAIALQPDEAAAYYNLGSVLAKSGQHPAEATRRLLEAKDYVENKAYMAGQRGPSC